VHLMLTSPQSIYICSQALGAAAALKEP
jgi:hypothetical protein